MPISPMSIAVCAAEAGWRHQGNRHNHAVPCAVTCLYMVADKVILERNGPFRRGAGRQNEQYDVPNHESQQCNNK